MSLIGRPILPAALLFLVGHLFSKNPRHTARHTFLCFVFVLCFVFGFVFVFCQYSICPCPQIGWINVTAAVCVCTFAHVDVKELIWSVR